MGGDVAAREGEAALVVLPRIGRPPLRLKARLLCAHRADAPGGRLELRLWRRPRGGYVASMIRPDGHALVEDAAAGESPAALAAWVEDACVAIRRAALPAGMPVTGVPLETWLARHRAQGQEREFLILAGDALAEWVAIMPQQTATEGR